MGCLNSYAYFLPFAPLADSVHKDRLQRSYHTTLLPKNKTNNVYGRIGEPIRP